MAKGKKVTQQDLTVAAVEILLKKHDGRVSPEIVVEEATDEASPFHKYFNWDEADAAHEHRLAQAAALIRTWKGSIMRINMETKIVDVKSTRRVQSPSGNRSKGGTSYETIEKIMADPEKRADMIRTVVAELMAYRKRYGELVALSEIWQAIDDAAETFSQQTRATVRQTRIARQSEQVFSAGRGRRGGARPG